MVTPVLMGNADARACKGLHIALCSCGPGSCMPPLMSAAGPRSILRSKTGNPFVEKDAAGCADGSPLLKAALDSSAEGGHHRCAAPLPGSHFAAQRPAKVQECWQRQQGTSAAGLSTSFQCMPSASGCHCEDCQGSCCSLGAPAEDPSNSSCGTGACRLHCKYGDLALPAAGQPAHPLQSCSEGLLSLCMSCRLCMRGRPLDWLGAGQPASALF